MSVMMFADQANDCMLEDITTDCELLTWRCLNITNRRETMSISSFVRLFASLPCGSSLLSSALSCPTLAFGHIASLFYASYRRWSGYVGISVAVWSSTIVKGGHCTILSIGYTADDE